MNEERPPADQSDEAEAPSAEPPTDASGPTAEAIAAESEKFRATLASIGDAVIATDVEGRITGMNPVAESLAHVSAAEALRARENKWRDLRSAALTILLLPLAALGGLTAGSIRLAGDFVEQD